MMTCISASASAASVPGSGARCSWHFSAVRLRYGSIAMSFAPRRLASCTRDHRCRLETIGFEPQMRISFASSKRSGSMPKEPPRVIFIPALPAGERMVLGALHFHRDAVLDGDLHRAGVGAIVRAGGAHALAFDGSLLDGSLHARTRSTVRTPQFYAVQGRTPGKVPKRMRSIWPMR